MGFEPNPHIQVSGGPSEGSILSLVSQDELGAVVDPRRDLDAEPMLPGLQALPSAGSAGGLRDSPSALASIARNHPNHLTED